MFKIEDHGVGEPHPLGDASDVVTDRVARGRVAARRRWVFRTTLMLVVTAVTLVLVLTWRRDQSTIQSAHGSLRSVTTDLQNAYDETGYLPSSFNKRGVTYYGNYADYAQKTSEPVILAHSGRVSLRLARDGHVVLSFEGGRVRQDWMSERELQVELQKLHVRYSAHIESIRSRPPELP